MPKYLKVEEMKDERGRFIKGHGPSNTGRTRFMGGKTPWNKGRVGLIPSENHGQWKGDDASYVAKHKWVYKHLGRPQKCSKCGDESSGKYNWHNISGEYRRESSDWARLCTHCHTHNHQNWKKAQAVRWK